MEIGSKLTSYFCNKHKIDPRTVIKIEKIKAKKLIVSNRIDLIAKLKYIEFREKGFDMSFARELYKKHIEAFSLGTYSEPGDENKDSIDKYFDVFDRMINNIKENGFDDTISVIPVGAKDTILDGAHRTAIAAYFDMEVSIVRFNDLYVNFGTEFFRKRLLDEKYLDYLVTEYSKLKDNVFFACVWPKATGEDKIREMNDLINNSTEVIYNKSVKLNYQGLRNFMVQIYSSQEWIGSIDNNFAGTQKKVDACFDRDGSLRCFVLEAENLEKILEMKSKIRDIFQIGNHSVHISDNQPESVQICNLLLNKNSVDLLNYGKLDYYKKFNKRLNKFKNNLKNNNLSLEDFIIDSSSVMGLYGIREANDIDFMTLSNEYKVIEDEKTTNHHDYISFYQTTIDDLVLNPSNYLVYNDLKFITLDVLKKFKKNRNEKKDQVDIQLISSTLSRKKTIKTILIKIINWVKRRVRTLRQYCKVGVRNLLEKVGLYEKVRSIYRHLQGSRG
jgi:hypothetical protein